MYNIEMKQPIYDPIAVQPMRDELVYVGFSEAVTPEGVEEAISHDQFGLRLRSRQRPSGCRALTAE